MFDQSSKPYSALLMMPEPVAVPSKLTFALIAADVAGSPSQSIDAPVLSACTRVIDAGGDAGSNGAPLQNRVAEEPPRFSASGLPEGAYQVGTYGGGAAPSGPSLSPVSFSVG